MFGNKDEIRVCRDCQIPLIWTFFWAYNEYFCINCGGHWGMMGAGDRVPKTPALRRQMRQLQKLWDSIKISLVPFSSYKKNNCKKCQTEDNHRRHLTPSERIKHKAVLRVLKNLEGVFSPV